MLAPCWFGTHAGHLSMSARANLYIFSLCFCCSPAGIHWNYMWHVNKRELIYAYEKIENVKKFPFYWFLVTPPKKKKIMELFLYSISAVAVAVGVVLLIFLCLVLTTESVVTDLKCIDSSSGSLKLNSWWCSITILYESLPLKRSYAVLQLPTEVQ